MKILISSLILLLFFVSTSYSQDAQQIIKDVQTKYRDINNATATFSKSFRPRNGKSSNASGTFYIQKQDKYRIETNGQVVVTDGQTSWSYSPSKKQLIIDKFVDSPNTFSPNRFLFDYPTEMFSDLEGEETINGNDCYKIKLTPRTKGNINSATIWVDKTESLIRRVTYSASDGTTTYTMRSISLNPGVAANKFSFTAPSGVEVIDLR